MVILTHYAARQAQRQGATHRSVELAAEFGARARARGGLFVRVLTKRAAQQAQRLHPLGVHTVQRALGTTIITDENDDRRTVVFVLPKRREVGAGRYHKHHREAVHV